MGGNIARRLMRAGHHAVAYNRTAAAAEALAGEGAIQAAVLAGMIARLEAPRAVWIMLPAGAPTEAAVAELAELMQPGDTIIDGGNTFYKDDVRRAAMLKERG